MSNGNTSFIRQEHRFHRGKVEKGINYVYTGRKQALFHSDSDAFPSDCSTITTLPQLCSFTHYVRYSISKIFATYSPGKSETKAPENGWIITDLYQFDVAKVTQDNA